MPDAALIAARKDALLLHSPLSFLRDVSESLQQERFGTGVASSFGIRAGEQVHPMSNGMGQWLLQSLDWDTNYFGTPTYRLFTGLFDRNVPANALATAAAELRTQLSTRGAFYAFSIVPAEDIALLQALTQGGWRLVETRLNFHCPVSEATLLAPASVRAARAEEAAVIGRISAAARNAFDRFHADAWFGEDRADAFLARYAEAAVAGKYADTVLVPDMPGLPVDSFLAIGDTPAVTGFSNGFSRVLLTAVGPQNRGWHQKLVSETVRRAAQMDFAHVLMTTQATNRAVFRTCEKVGFRLGSTTHVLACHND